MKINATQDTFFHTVITITEKRAVPESLSQRTAVLPKPSCLRISLRIPPYSKTYGVKYL